MIQTENDVVIMPFVKVNLWLRHKVKRIKPLQLRYTIVVYLFIVRHVEKYVHSEQIVNQEVLGMSAQILFHYFTLTIDMNDNFDLHTEELSKKHAE